MSNRARVVNALAYVLVGGAALHFASTWLALLASVAAAQVGPRRWRWPLHAAALILAAVTVFRVPFAEGQALLSDFVFPCLLLGIAAMSPRSRAPRAWHLGVAAAAGIFLLGGTAHDQALTGELGAALCVALGSLGA